MTDPDPLANHEKDIFFVTSAVSWCMCLLQICGVYFFYNLRGLMIIEKRYPRLVMLEAIVTMFVLAVIYPVSISAVYRYPDISWEGWQPLCVALSAFTLQIVPVIEVCRIWLISYDLQYLHSSKNQRWKTLIDVSYAQKDWYLQNRGKWGNKKYITRLGFVYYVVSSTVLLIATLLMVMREEYVYNAIVTGLRFIMAIVFMVIPIYLYVKTPRNLQDQFLFHKVYC